MIPAGTYGRDSVTRRWGTQVFEVRKYVKLILPEKNNINKNVSGLKLYSIIGELVTKVKILF
jgi:hypothetical protein